jgi:hypothetical protein
MFYENTKPLLEVTNHVGLEKQKQYYVCNMGQICNVRITYHFLNNMARYSQLAIKITINGNYVYAKIKSIV